MALNKINADQSLYREGIKQTMGRGQGGGIKRALTVKCRVCKQKNRAKVRLKMGMPTIRRRADEHGNYRTVTEVMCECGHFWFSAVESMVSAAEYLVVKEPSDRG